MSGFWICMSCSTSPSDMAVVVSDRTGKVLFESPSVNTTVSLWGLLVPIRREFQQYVTPDDGRKFGELYNVQLMQANLLDPVSKVCITTVQRLYFSPLSCSR